MLTVLAGGVGAARFLRGLLQVVDPERVTVVVNVGDDLDLLGLRICADLDSITYTLAGRVHPGQQWGRDDERFLVRDELRRFGHDAWFTLGDRDLALHLHRAARLAEGAALSTVTAEIVRAHGLALTLLPVTDDRLTTRIHTVDGRDLHFQEWWVRERAVPAVARVEFRGAGAARPAPGVEAAILGAEAVLVAPSNPVVSVAPIRAVPAVAAALAATPAPVVGVSPLIAGRVVRGMADRLLPAVGATTSAEGVARWYGSRADGGLLDAWVVDTVDAAVQPALAALGLRAAAVDTLMDDPAVAAELARTCLALAGVRP
jgi:LPPG:FO 2-phospho-L-lactate transferase